MKITGVYSMNVYCITITIKTKSNKTYAFACKNILFRTVQIMFHTKSIEIINTFTEEAVCHFQFASLFSCDKKIFSVRVKHFGMTVIKIAFFCKIDGKTP